MAAQNLAARLIQSAYRGYITRRWQDADNWYEQMRDTTLQERLRQERLERLKACALPKPLNRTTLEDKYAETYCIMYSDFPGGGYRAFAAAKIQSVFRKNTSRKRTMWLRYRM